MTLFGWVSARRRGATPVPQRTPSVTSTLRARTHVPNEYLSLYTYLERRYAGSVVLTFDQMESLLGFALPASARADQDWWTGAAGPADRHTDSWTMAGRTAAPNLLARTVTFERQP